MRALRKLQREQEPKSPFVFTSERGSPFTTAGFARMVERAGVEAKLGFKAHPHMLRHACGFALANKGHDTRALQAYLGHRNIQHTVRYTELSPGRFRTSGDDTRGGFTPFQWCRIACPARPKITRTISTSTELIPKVKARLGRISIDKWHHSQAAA